MCNSTKNTIQELIISNLEIIQRSDVYVSRLDNIDSER